MAEVTYDASGEIDPAELREFYAQMRHEICADPAKLQVMVDNSAVFVAARADGKLIGLARGVCDGLRGYLTECKLDPRYQGPAALSRTDGRIEHDSFGIGREMAQRVIDGLREQGCTRIDVLAWGTEVDFLEELGFRRVGGLVGLTMRAEAEKTAAAGKAASLVG